jgi:UDP-2-acetamido-2,6-beta-L-arabino-hexul-4-ose reductase
VRILVAGANGFIGKNLLVTLARLDGVETLPITRNSTSEDLAMAAQRADFVFHLAGTNRSPDAREFTVGNVDSTRQLCAELAATGRQIPVVYSSSVQADRDNVYGQTKLAAEAVLKEYQAVTGSPIAMYRLPNVFGKWCRPNYNSAVATFCYNIARGLPIQVNDPDAQVTLAYVDDVIGSFVARLAGDSFLQRQSRELDHRCGGHRIEAGAVRHLCEFPADRGVLLRRAAIRGYPGRFRGDAQNHR